MKCFFDVDRMDFNQRLLTLTAENDEEKELLSRLNSEKVTSGYSKCDGRFVNVTLILQVQPYEAKRQ